MTAQRSHEAGRLEEVIAAQSEIAAASLGLDDVMRLIVARAQKLTGAGAAVVEILEGDEMVYRAASGTASPHVGLRLNRATSISGLCVRAGSILLSADTETDDRVDREACRRVSARSLIVVPLWHRKQAVGVLKVMSARPHAFGPEDSSILELMANVIAAALDRAASETSIRQAEEMFRLTFENAPIGMAVVSIEGRWLKVNRALCEIVGCTADELQQRAAEDLIHPDDREATTARLQELLRGEVPRSVLGCRYLRQDGSVATVMVQVSLQRDPAGAPRHFIQQIEDVGEKQRLQERLTLSDRMASVGTLAAGMAHEINNPLAFAISNLEMIDEEVQRLPSLEDLKPLVADAREGCDRVRKIVRDLKTLSRPSQTERARLDLREVTELAIKMTFNEIRHRARLVKDFADPPPVEADEARLGQVIVNLLMNAAQAIPEGDAARNEIRVVTRTGPSGHAIIEVRDSGVGIPQASLGRIFDPFYTTRSIGGGTGLGLSICHALVTDLGGHIEVESEQGKGSVFRVILPAATIAAPPAVPVSLPAERRPLRQARVLIVDDEVMIARSLCRALGEHDVAVVGDARLALARIRAGEQPDVILCDLMMPEMTGMQLHAELSRTHPALTPRIVFMTGGAFTPGARAFLDAVPNQRVEKPVDIQHLRAVVRGFVSASSQPP